MAAKAKKQGSKKTAKKKNTETSFVGTEITIWMTLAVSILLMISNFGFGGFVGEMLAGMMEDIFGWAAYVLPFVLFGSVTFIISNRENPNAYVKVGAVLCLLALVCTFLELVDKKGGLLGELLAGILTPAIGVAGAYVVDIILMIICLVASILQNFIYMPVVLHALAGIRIVVCALMLNTVFTMMKKGIVDKLGAVVFLIAFLLACFTPVPTAVVIVLSGVTGMIAKRMERRHSA